METSENGVSMRGLILKLLIAPIWNGNGYTVYKSSADFVTFNRTNLEWKPSEMTKGKLLGATFNRTNLEWKLGRRTNI